MAKNTKTKTAEQVKKTEDISPVNFAFGKINYILLIAGVALIILGFILMAGGGSSDPKVFNEDMFDFRRLTLAPILILAGFAVELVAILKRPRD